MQTYKSVGMIIIRCFVVVVLVAGADVMSGSVCIFIHRRLAPVIITRRHLHVCERVLCCCCCCCFLFG